MKLLDLFCKAGGAAAGYHRAGFDVTGVDIEPQPRYPFRFIQADAVMFLQMRDLGEYDIIHASPPCQSYSKCKSLAQARNGGKYGNHPDLIAIIRDLLRESGKPYIIENVEGAPLINPIALCGTQFEHIYTQRKRIFESNIPLTAPERNPVRKKTPTAGNGIGADGFISICGSGGVKGLNAKQIVLYWGFALGGIDWMNRKELAEAVPPAYTEFLGRQAFELLQTHGKERYNP